MTLLTAAPGDSSAVAVAAACLSRRLCASGALAVGCVLLGMPALAQGEGGSGRQVVVTTRIIMASNTGVAQLPGADNGPLRESLRLFPYKSYRLIQHEVRRVDMSRMEEFPVPGQRHLLVQPTGFKNGRVSLDVMLMQGRKILVNTALKLKDGGEFVVAGPQHEDGVLFLAIGASISKSRKQPSSGLLLQRVESK